MFDYETKALLDGNVAFELQVSVRAKPVQYAPATDLEDIKQRRYGIYKCLDVGKVNRGLRAARESASGLLRLDYLPQTLDSAINVSQMR